MSFLCRCFHRSLRNGTARSKDKYISNSVNYFQISLHKVMPLCTPSRNVWECLFSPSFAAKPNVKLLNFCLSYEWERVFWCSLSLYLIMSEIIYVEVPSVFSLKYPYLAEDILSSKALFLHLPSHSPWAPRPSYTLSQDGPDTCQRNQRI